jgi:hypothetical protein
MKRLTLLVVVAGVTFWTGCTKLGPFEGFFHGNTYEVQILKIFPTPGVQDCKVDNKERELDRESLIFKADKVSWCVQNGDTTQYIIHFTNGSPFSDNDFSANCSQYRSPAPGKPKGDYIYEIDFATARCSDPKVILK